MERKVFTIKATKRKGLKISTAKKNSEKVLNSMMMELRNHIKANTYVDLSLSFKLNNFHPFCYCIISNPSSLLFF